jgi:hypothetical protein
LRQCRTELFRLEVRDTYGVPSEDEPFQRFLNNEPFDYREWFQDWYDIVQELRARGVSVSRVRVVTVPHSDYQRWSLAEVAPLNIEAGEEIRYLNRHEAGSVSADDYWIIDNKRVAFTLADQDGRAVGRVAVTTDPRIVGFCRGEKERLWPLATPYAEYAR